MARVLAGPIPDDAILRRIKFTAHNTVAGRWFWSASLVGSPDGTEENFDSGVRLVDSGGILPGVGLPVWNVDNFADIAFVWEGLFHRRVIGGPGWVHLRASALNALTFRINGFVEWEDGKPDFPLLVRSARDGSVS